MINGISSNMFANQIDKFRNINLDLENTQPSTIADGANTIGNGANKDFSEMLGNLVKSVDQNQKVADTSLADLASGKNNTTIQDVVMKMEEAEIAFSLMKEIRNKLLAAYKDILKL